MSTRAAVFKRKTANQQSWGPFGLKRVHLVIRVIDLAQFSRIKVPSDHGFCLCTASNASLHLAIFAKIRSTGPLYFQMRWIVASLRS